jgi:hypothetical protein
VVVGHGPDGHERQARECGALYVASPVPAEQWTELVEYARVRSGCKPAAVRSTARPTR